MDTIGAVLFDKDGTLFDYHRTWANWARAFLLDLAEGDTAMARELSGRVGFDFDVPGFRDDSVIVAATPREIAEALLPSLPGASSAAISARMARLSASVPQVEATPLRPLMTELAERNLRLGVVTNDCEAPARAHLEAAGVLDCFDHVFGCDSGYAPKPNPDMLIAFAELTGCDPARTVMIGDSTHDLMAAKAAGMIPLAVLTGIAGHSVLAPHAESVLPSIAAVPRWLDARLPAESAA